MPKFKNLYALAFLVLLSVRLAGTAHAAIVEVELLENSANGPMVFEPALVELRLGDSIRFMPGDKSFNIETVPGMVPDGAIPFATGSGDEITIKFDKVGLYGLRSMHQYNTGMVGLVVVERPANEKTAKKVKHPGKAADRFKKLFAEYDEEHDLPK